jgi:uncharacterized membrane protein
MAPWKPIGKPMDAYTLLKVVHILSATVLFGTGLGTALHFWLANRTGDVRAITVSARSTVFADFAFTTPAAIVQPVTGIALALMAGFPLSSPWIVISIALYLLAGACWVPVVFIQLRMRRMAEDAVANDRRLGPAYQRLLHAWFALGWPAFAALVIVFWLMVAKPAFAG